MVRATASNRIAFPNSACAALYSAVRCSATATSSGLRRRPIRRRRGNRHLQAAPRHRPPKHHAIPPQAADRPPLHPPRRPQQPLHRADPRPITHHRRTYCPTPKRPGHRHRRTEFYPANQRNDQARRYRVPQTLGAEQHRPGRHLPSSHSRR